MSDAVDNADPSAGEPRAEIPPADERLAEPLAGAPVEDVPLVEAPTKEPAVEARNEPAAVDAPPVAREPRPSHHRPPRTAWHTGRARTLGVAVVAVAVTAAATLLVVRAARTIGNSKAGRTSVPTGPPVSQLPSTPAGLIVPIGADHKPATMSVLALSPTGKGGTIVIVPAGTGVSVPGSTRADRLAQSYESGGLPAQNEAVSGFLGITTSVSAEFDETQLAALLAPYAPLHVNLDDRALDTDTTGKEFVAYSAGPVTLTAAEAAHLLVARGPNESEIARIGRVAEIWQAVLARGSSATTTTAPAATTPSDVGDFLHAVVSGTAAVRQIPVKPVLDAVSNPDGVDLLSADSGATRLLMAQVLPGAISPANGNIRLRVINPTGDPELSYFAVSRLAFVGANIVLVTETSGPAEQQNAIEYQDAAEQDAAARYRPVIGGAVMRQSPDHVEGIDATVVLGHDFRTFMNGEQAKATTTTSSTSSTVAASTTTTQKKARG